MSGTSSEAHFKIPQPPSALGGSSSEISSKRDEKKRVTSSSVYVEPEWSGDPPPNYCFEVIKQGTVISGIDIKKSYLIVGRMTDCDVVVEHPSGSRYHAVVQYCKGVGGHRKGFYIYDLGSTHGTFLNKEQIKPKVYYYLKVGYVLKFGSSTRLYVFQGPDEEEEEVLVEEDTENDTCNWGLGEDAEEDDLTENPFALSTENEELYLSDPKKTLRNWFEREGFDLEYKVEEKGFKNFVCQIKLPIDSPSGEDYVTVEASVSGKKKEAVVACALEACRVLDRQGLLRQANQESRKQKRKNWESDDFYDSDEDTYLDRTGTIEKKREFRKRLGNHTQVETHDSLVKKIEKVSKEIEEIEKKLAESQSPDLSTNDDQMDPLDSYMCAITMHTKLDRVTKSKLRQQLTELKQERSKYENLRDIVYTCGMPELSSSSRKEVDSCDTNKYNSEQTEKMENTTLKRKSVPSTRKHCLSSKVKMVQNQSDLSQEDKAEKESLVRKDNKMLKISKETERILKNEDSDKNDASSLCQQNSDSHEKEESTKHIKQMKNGTGCTDEYSMWLPPEGQSGDGTTHLNSKYGY